MRTAGKPGYQGSETTGVDFTVYHNGDPVLADSGGTTTFKGRKPGDGDSMIVEAQTMRALGSSATWSVLVKESRAAHEILDYVVDDDWVDLTFKRHGVPYHVMRGLVDDVRETLAVVNGATTAAFLISGRDFQKVWEKTPIWFDRFVAENVAGAAMLQIFQAETAAGQTVSSLVRIFLQRFLDVIEGYGRACWRLPAGMPGRTSDKFIENVVFDVDADYDDEYNVDLPSRAPVDPQLMMPQGDCWTLAQQWSDPAFCELFVDQTPYVSEVFKALGSEDRIGDAGDPKNTRMTVVLRNRPFPTLERGMDSPWFSLPNFWIPRQQVTTQNIGRSGYERLNAFFVSPRMTQELLGTGKQNLVQPLWDKEDIRLHGMRKYDIDTLYVSNEGTAFLIAEPLRERARDWYCLNPYLLNGTISLARLRPEIRVGTRVTLPQARRPTETETYYVETVGHTWRAITPGVTNLGVTRGYRMSDEQLMELLERQAGRYTAGIPALPGEDFAYRPAGAVLPSLNMEGTRNA